MIISFSQLLFNYQITTLTVLYIEINLQKCFIENILLSIIKQNTMFIICTLLHIIVHILYNVNMNIGKKLKELRKNYNITQKEFAEKINISRVNYTRYENNKVRPDFETIIKIADFYDISLDELFDRK